MKKKTGESEFIKKTKQMIRNGENNQIEFKRDLGGLKESTFVQFANSPLGGTILVGVSDDGSIHGCQLTDTNRLNIQNKASGCIPHIQIAITGLNINGGNIIAIDVPTGGDKPYSTSGGEYCIREDGRRRALTPPELLRIFLETQTNEFYHKFKQVTEDINIKIKHINDEQLPELFGRMDEMLQTTESNLESAMETYKDIQGNIEDMASEINSQLRGIFETAENAESLSDEAMTYSDEASTVGQENNESLEALHKNVNYLHDKIDAIMTKHGVEDPYWTSLKRMVERNIEIGLKEKPNAQLKTIFKPIMLYIVKNCPSYYERLYEYSKVIYKGLKKQHKQGN